MVPNFVFPTAIRTATIRPDDTVSQHSPVLDRNTKAADKSATELHPGSRTLHAQQQAINQMGKEDATPLKADSPPDPEESPEDIWKKFMEKYDILPATQAWLDKEGFNSVATLKRLTPEAYGELLAEKKDKVPPFSQRLKEIIRRFHAPARPPQKPPQQPPQQLPQQPPKLMLNTITVDWHSTIY